MPSVNLILPAGEAVVTGKQITFSSPCSNDGLNSILINGIEYALVDACRKPIGDVPEVFVQGALVSVVIDESNKLAYVQNAANNRYGSPIKQPIVDGVATLSLNTKYRVYAEVKHGVEADYFDCTVQLGSNVKSIVAITTLPSIEVADTYREYFDIEILSVSRNTGDSTEDTVIYEIGGVHNQYSYPVRVLSMPVPTTLLVTGATSIYSCPENMTGGASVTPDGDVTPGEDGGYYVPAVTDNEDGTVTFTFSASREGMPDINPVTVTIPKGKDGKSAYETYLDNGGFLTESAWLESLNGKDGKSAYDIAVDNGFVGDETDFMIALKGKDGGHYSPSIHTITENSFKISFTPSGSDMPVIEDVTITLPTAEDGDDGVGIESIVQTTTSNEDGGENVITITLTNGNKSTFKVKNGSKGGKGDAGKGISKVEKTSTSGLSDTYTITYTDGSTSTYTVMNGDKGDAGIGIKSILQTTTSSADGGENVVTVTLTDDTQNTFKFKNGSKGSAGRGISKVEKTGTVDHTDTYTITYTDSTTSTFTVVNGKDGTDGVGIKTVAQTTTSSTDGGENVITVTLTNGNTSTFKVKNGSKGSKGDAGNGIKSIAKTSTSGLVDTYTITFTDNTTTTFTVTNGKDGTNGAGEETPFIVLPSNLYAVVGHEFVLYYNNILGAMRPEDFAVTTEFPSGSTLPNREEPYIGAMFEWGLRIMPQEKHIGNHTLTIKVFSRRTWKVVATKSVTLVVSKEKTFSDKKVIFIGDSLTDARVYPAELERMTNNGIKSIGTLNKSIGFNGGMANLNTEGRSGACSYGYVNREVVCGNYTNPFYNPDETYTLTLDDKYSGEGIYASALPVDNSGSKSVISHHFDFAYYMANSGVEEPDAVFLNLGSNCGNRSSYKTAYMSFCAMVDRIRAYSATLPIFIHLWPPKSEAGSTDRKASGSVSGWVNKRTYFYEIIQFFIDKFDGDSRVILVPTYTMIDPVYDFKRQTIPVSARNTEQVTLGQSDGTHPDTSGYLHMADSYFNTMMAWLKSEDGGETETTYEVTNNLINVTNPNDTTSVKAGNAYTTTLTANTGYTLDTVTVTMEGSDGSDITVTDDGVISITSVTGNIVITATAVESEEPEEPTVVNLVDPSTANDNNKNTALFADEWVNGYKFSSSSFPGSTLSSSTGIITTDLIPVTMDSKLRIEGADISTAAKKNELRLVLFNADGTITYSSYYTPTSSTDNSVVDQTLLSEGVVLVTLKNLKSALAYPNLSYVRISCYCVSGNNSNLIVTTE